MTRSQRNHRNSYSRRRSSRNVELQGSEENEDGNDNNMEKDESSNDERPTEIRQRRRRRRASTRSSQPSSSVANSDGYPENDLEMSQENRGISPGLALNSEILAWGRGGARSHTRHGNSSGCNSKSSRNTRLSKLVDYLRNLDENSDEVKKDDGRGVLTYYILSGDILSRILIASSDHRRKLTWLLVSSLCCLSTFITENYYFLICS